MALFSTSNVHAPASNTAAVVTYPAVSGQAYKFSNGVAWSYDASPTGGLLTITVGGSTVFSMSITSAGAGFIPFNDPLWSGKNEAVVFTLAAGGSGVTGKLSVLGCHAIY